MHNCEALVTLSVENAAVGGGRRPGRHVTDQVRAALYVNTSHARRRGGVVL